MTNFVKRFVRDEEGVTMVEYGLMAALIAVVCIAAVTLLGDNLSAKFQTIADAVSAAGAGGGGDAGGDAGGAADGGAADGGATTP